MLWEVDRQDVRDFAISKCGIPPEALTSEALDYAVGIVETELTIRSWGLVNSQELVRYALAFSLKS